MPRVLLGFAGLMGAAGVILAALAAHKSPGLQPAALMLMVHAPAVIAAAQAALLHRALALFAAAGLALGATLFSSDIVLLALAGVQPVPMMAPTGGFIMIVGWILLAIAALKRPAS